MTTGDQASIEELLLSFPEPIRESANVLRGVVKGAVPEAIERLRSGWRLIGYDVPAGRRTRYFAYVAPQTSHVHLGFEYGAWMADPRHLLEGAHLKLRQVRYVSFGAGQPVPTDGLSELVREAARVALLSPAERISLLLDQELDPTRQLIDG